MVQWRLSMRVTSFPPPPEELDIQHDVHAGLEDNLCVGEVKSLAIGHQIICS